MQRSLPSAAVAAVVLSLSASTVAQNCYESTHQCFTFGPPRLGATATAAPETTGTGKIDTGGLLDLRSQRLTIEGDIRLRVRVAETRAQYPYADADQQSTRARIRMRYQVNDKVHALGEFNLSETWAGSESYSDALEGENFNGVSQFYLQAEDMLGFQDTWRVGRSEYILGNGLVLGSCDFLQRPGTFTGVWVSRKFCEHVIEGFVFDDYGPLQSVHDGVRYVGATARIAVGQWVGDTVQAIKPYYMAGTRDGDSANSATNATEEDAWLGIDGEGQLPGGFGWNVEYANRFVDGGMDRMAWRGVISKPLDLFGGFWRSVSVQITDAEGKMDVGNPADFNSAGLLHQYGGAWRSDMQTWQLGFGFVPAEDVTFDVNLLTLDRRGTAAQLGDFEADAILGAKMASGVYLAGGYGIDNDRRQVGYMQLTLNF